MYNGIQHFNEFRAKELKKDKNFIEEGKDLADLVNDKMKMYD